MDFCGLPSDFPGLAGAIGDPRSRVIAVQARFAAEINHQRFIPFLTLHELEAWLFSSPETVASHFGDSELIEPLRDIVRCAGEPELINDGRDTYP